MPARTSSILTSLIWSTTLPHDQQYSYDFNGSHQVLDHVVVSQSFLAKLSRFAIARNDADFPEVFRNDPNRSERISDHDMPVAYFTLPEATPPVLHLPANITAEATSPAGAIVSYNATATDARDTNVVVNCAPPSGSTFALGGTTVNCSATNSRNKTAEGSFSITVVDTTAPFVVLNGVTNGATYTLGAVPAASCSATDSVYGHRSSGRSFHHRRNCQRRWPFHRHMQRSHGRRGQYRRARKRQLRRGLSLQRLLQPRFNQ